MWVKSRTKKDGTPVNTNAAEKIVRQKLVTFVIFFSINWFSES